MLHTKNNKKIAKVAIYARYSSKNQSKDSADDQIKKIKREIAEDRLRFFKYTQNKWDLDVSESRIFKDEAKSGKSTKSRSGFQKLLRGVQEGAFDVVVIDDLSRLTRDFGDQIKLYELLKFNEIELVSVSDGISSEDPGAKSSFHLKGMVNEMSNTGHANRTRRGQVERVRAGFSTGDKCYGYDSRSTSTRSSGGHQVPSKFKLHINPEEAKVVNLLFDLYLKGYGYTAIARVLNERLIKSPRRGRLITGKEVNWNPSTIRNMLIREKYIGRWHWGKARRAKNPLTEKIVKKPVDSNNWLKLGQDLDQNEDLRIISQKKWNAVQDKFVKNQKVYKGKQNLQAIARSSKEITGKGDSLLAGVLRCSECCGMMLQVSGKSGGYFGCYNYHRKNKEICSNKRVIKRSKIEAVVIDKLQQVLKQPEHLDTAVVLANKKLKDFAENSPSKIQSLEIQVAELEVSLANILQEIMRGNSSGLLTEKMQSLENEKAYISEQISALLQLGKAKTLSVTKEALLGRYETLSGYLEKDPIKGNMALREFLPQGLFCRPESSDAKNRNQQNAKWEVRGTFLANTNLGFSNLLDGGDGGN